jgi:RNA polymerase sigma-70 factor (ECF subfamily)
MAAHSARLYRIACGLCRSREDAEDLLQETFARVLARPREVRSGDDLPYLVRALRNTFANEMRTASRRPMTEIAIADQVVADPRPATRPEQAIVLSELYCTIAALDADFRQALVAVDLVGLTYRDAADVLGVPEGTIASRVLRARRRLAARLQVS